MRARWDGDDRGHGLANAGQLVPGASELLDALREPDWVAEEPERHLRPHIESWCKSDPRLALIDARSDERGAYVVDLEWCGPPSVGQTRAAVFSLIGSFAESATYVRQRRGGNDGGVRLQFEVGTGELADAAFAPHGHVVVINVER